MIKHALLCLCIDCEAEREPNFGIPIKFDHCTHCEREDNGQCIDNAHYDPCPFEDCVEGVMPS